MKVPSGADIPLLTPVARIGGLSRGQEIVHRRSMEEGSHALNVERSLEDGDNDSGRLLGWRENKISGVEAMTGHRQGGW